MRQTRASNLAVAPPVSVPAASTMVRRLVPLLVTALLATGWAAPVAAQENEKTGPLVIPRTDRSITLDGHIDPSEWKDARRLPLVQRKTNFGAEPDLRTEILITHTSEAIYLAYRCFDPEEPVITSFKRDGSGAPDDKVNLLIDSFNDDETALWFRTSPAGNRTDAAIYNDASGSQWLDFSRNLYWEAEVRRTGEGWFVEMRIPASSLRFETTANRAVMGITAWRGSVRKNEQYVFPAIGLEQGGASIVRPSLAQDAIFEGLESEPPLRVTPYLLGGVGRSSTLNEQGSAYRQPTNWTYDAGLDIKYGLTSNLTLDLTFNTDFAQVEADNQQVNLTRFPLFFPEKRRFFLERSSNFAFDFGGPNRLFYSRRIGLHEGNQVRILGGGRLVGHRGGWDLGVLSMQTAREPDLGSGGQTLPSENFSVVRVRREVLNPNSEVGGILTSRIGLEGRYNLAYGLNTTIRPAGDEYLTVKWAQTFSDRHPEQLLSLTPARAQLMWERRAFEGLSYNLRLDRAGRRYRPEMGFELRENYLRIGDRLGYGWLPGEDSPVQQQQLNLRGEAYFRNGDGSLQSLAIGPAWSLSTNSGHSVEAQLRRRTEDLRRPFSLTEAVSIPRDRYDFYEGELSYRTRNDYELNISTTLTGGEYYDGRRGTAQISPTWNPSRFLQVSGFYQFNRVLFPDRHESFSAHVSRLRLNVTPNVEHAISGFIQHNSGREIVVANLRYRYNPKQGNDFYLVYNERLNTSRSATGIGPRRPRSAQRAVLLKYIHTFNW